jgi:F0F1-type ATP synthase assembly protein I
MSEATQKMIDDLDEEIERLENEVAERDKIVARWKARAEEAEAPSFDAWFTYTVANVAAILAILAVGAGLWWFIHWAAQPDHVAQISIPCVNGSDSQGNTWTYCK